MSHREVLESMNLSPRVHERFAQKVDPKKEDERSDHQDGNVAHEDWAEDENDKGRCRQENSRNATVASRADDEDAVCVDEIVL